MKMGEGDELCGQEESFKDWAKAVFQVIRLVGGRHFMAQFLLKKKNAEREKNGAFRFEIRRVVIAAARKKDEINAGF